MTVKELIEILEEVHPSDKVMLQTNQGNENVKSVCLGADADYLEIYIEGESNDCKNEHYNV